MRAALGGRAEPPKPKPAAASIMRFLPSGVSGDMLLSRQSRSDWRLRRGALRSRLDEGDRDPANTTESRKKGDGLDQRRDA
mgnify:CR=1 FL=1